MGGHNRRRGERSPVVGVRYNEGKISGGLELGVGGIFKISLCISLRCLDQFSRVSVALRFISHFLFLSWWYLVCLLQ